MTHAHGHRSAVRGRPATARGAALARRASAATADDEHDHEAPGGQQLHARLAKFKLPKTVDYTTEMPCDPNGKLYERKLRDPNWEGLTRAI
ncbi:MAG: hypothetical protein ABIX10_13125 [Acidimicrobiales bacterium]